MAASPTLQGGATALYHRLSSYNPDRHWAEPIDDERVRQDFIPLRPGREPRPYKHYPAEAARVVLPRVLPALDVSAAALLSGGVGPRRGPLSLYDVATILFHSAGVVRHWVDARGKRRDYRAASSAGNRHPLEVYLDVRAVPGLADGVWHYGVERHELVAIAPAVPDGPTVPGVRLIITGLAWRSCWRYAERGYRHLWWDCGTLLCQAEAVARALGWPSQTQTAFVDAQVAAQVGVDSDDEVALAVLHIGDAPQSEPVGRPLRALPDPTTEAFALIAAAHRESMLVDSEAVVRWLAAHPPSSQRSLPPAVAVPADAAELSLQDVLGRRGSARRLDPAGTLSAEQHNWLQWVLDRPLPWDGGPAPDRTLLLRAVDGATAGRYRMVEGHPRLVGSLSAQQSRTFCLGQQLGADAALLVLLTGPAELPADPRAYRSAQLGAGLLLGRTYLAAAILGLGCSGLTFVDDLLEPTVGEQVTGLAIAAVGRLPCRGVLAGAPGRPNQLP